MSGDKTASRRALCPVEEEEAWGGLEVPVVAPEAVEAVWVARAVVVARGGVRDLMRAAAEGAAAAVAETETAAVASVAVEERRVAKERAVEWASVVVSWVAVWEQAEAASREVENMEAAAEEAVRSVTETAVAAEAVVASLATAVREVAPAWAGAATAWAAAEAVVEATDPASTVEWGPRAAEPVDFSELLRWVEVVSVEAAWVVASQAELLVVAGLV